MITENLSTLKIHKLTQEQYDRELEAGRVDPSAIYLTPEEDNSNIYIQNEEPVNAEEGSLWVDMDANGMVGVNNSDRLILPTTYMSQDGSNGIWDHMECVYSFNLHKPIVIGRTYTITIDGINYVSVAENYSDEILVTNGIVLNTETCRIYYQYYGTSFTPDYNALYSPFNIVEDYGEGSGMIPVTMTIRETDTLLETNEKQIVAEQVVMSDEAYYAPITATTSLEAGRKYYVKCDGGAFSCVAQTINDITFIGNPFVCSDSEMLFFDDKSLIENTMEPFFIHNDDASTHTLLHLYIDDERTCRISVTTIVKTLLDEDIDAIKSSLPIVKMTVTFDDGTTKSFKLFGEEMAN